jgi:glycosyltransferase involved in cell wall biosynthesis
MKKPSILIIADPILPVPPPLYGGIERIIHFLAEGLSELGWNVTLFCHPDSECKVNKVAYPAPGIERKSRLRNLKTLGRHLLQHRYDIIHSFAHFDMMAPLWPLKQTVVQSFQAFPDWKAFTKRTRFIPKRNFHITTCGFHMVDRFSPIAPTRAIHNGIIIDQFDFAPEVSPDSPLVFLGRIEPIKGTHLAIQIANATGRELIIAGNRSTDAKLDQYFIDEIEPHLNERIRYIGPVNDIQKNQLLGSAAAFLMPIEWDEPFGIVMAEALACGTPVIGTARGALPEIVDHGLTGACCQTVDEMIEAVRHVEDFSRYACRQSAESRFASNGIVDQYIALYESILDR